MKIGIAHFTDIHFSTKTNIDNKLSSCISALKNDFYGVGAIYFVLSGDIAFSGKKEEFDLAKSFFNKIKQLLEKHYQPLKIKVIIVPGNHDCDISRDTQLRRNSIENMKYSTLGSDNSVVDGCLDVQEDFWKYYSLYNPIPSDKLFWQVKDEVDGCKICFNCINTSWVSQKNEKVGGLFFPVKRYDSFNNFDCDLTIGVWHHPYNWFNPSTTENNKKEFEMFTERLASVHFLGHEHQNEFYKKKNMNTGDKLSLLSGKVFSDDAHPNNSGFQTIVLDLNTKIGELKQYDWRKTFFDSVATSEVSFKKEVFKKYELNSDFLKSLEEIKIPLVIGDKSKVCISEIFVFPDLEVMNADTKILDNYPDSQEILKNKYGHCLLAGDSQIGKSSLLRNIFLKKYAENKTPILMTGKDIKELDFKRILKRVFRRQYKNGDEHFEEYQQLDKSNKVLLIDDYHTCSYSATSVYEMLREAMEKFDLVVLSIDKTHSMLPVLQAEFKAIKFFNIKPLGHFKRNALVERYIYLKGNTNYDNDVLTEQQETFDKVQGVLGDKLIPSFPIFILSILQSLELNAPRQNETSFGYCYQTLIHYSLFKANVKIDDIDGYFNFLSEIAYEFIKRDVDVISENDFMQFFTNYKIRFVFGTYSKVRETLISSRILIFDDDEIYFGYDYILYYLSAKKIADIIHKPEGKAIVKKLFDKLHIEKNGNILVFVTHHSKDITFIEDSLLHSMIILTDYQPITLASDDPFYNHLKQIIDDFSNDILELHKNPKTVREEKLRKMDEIESNRQIRKEEEEEDLISLPIRQSLRSIDIVGQIIRNRKGSLEKDQIKNMIKEVYTTGFRTVSYTAELLNSVKNKIIIVLNKDETILDSSRGDIEKAISEFIITMSLDSCLGIFAKITSVMGIKDLKVLFNEVADELDTPAAKLVSFGINSYYGNISENELKAIVAYLKGNNVAMQILRGRVKTYVYNRNLDIKTKQKFAKLLDMSVPLPNQNPDY